MTDDQSYGHVAVAFAEIARTFFSARTVGETLQQIDCEDSSPSRVATRPVSLF
jgi:hypothetical protein